MLRDALCVVALPLLLAGCGLGEPAATAAAAGAAAGGSATQARQVLDSVQQRVDLGAREANARLWAAETASQ